MEEPVDKHDVDLGGSLNLGDRCARAIAELILASERRLWILWPYLVDDIYIVVKDAISGLPNGTK